MLRASAFSVQRRFGCVLPQLLCAAGGKKWRDSRHSTCGAFQCGSAWSMADLARVLPATEFAAYAAKLAEVREERLVAELARQHAAALVQKEEGGARAVAKDEEIALHRRVLLRWSQVELPALRGSVFCRL